MSRKTRIKLGISGILIVILIALIISIVNLANNHNTSPKDEELNMPRNYTYETAVASNGMELHYLRTRPSNVKLEVIRNNVTAAPYYGINGGFFEPVPYPP